MAFIDHSSGTWVTRVQGEGWAAANLDAMPANGWITSIEFYMGAANSGEQAEGALVLYVGTTREWFEVGLTAGYNGGSPLIRTRNIAPAIRVNSGASLRWGILARGAGTDMFWRTYIDTNSPGDTVVEMDHSSGSLLPPGTWTTDETNVDVSARGRLEYVAQTAPSKGTWQSGTVSGDTADLDPLFVGNLPHPEAVGWDEEYSQTVQVRITRQTDGLVVWNNSFTTTTTERNNRSFSRRLGLPEGTLLPGHTYTAEYRHMDSWGVWSTNYSDPTTFTMLVGPQEPTIVTPAPDSKIDYTGEGQTGAPLRFYAGEYYHPDSVAMNQVQVRVYNETGSVLLYDSGWIAPTSGTGTPDFEVAQWHSDLLWGTGYQVHMRTSDTNGLQGPWAIANFQTDSPPSAPTGLDPANGQSTGNSVLSCQVVDPDATEFGDIIAWVEFDVLEDGVAPAGYPQTVTGPFASGSLVTLDIAADVSTGTTIEWRARASDGVQTGDWSAYASYQYADAPDVAIVAPSSITNLVRQPSSEYDPSLLTTFWTEVANDASNFVQRLNDVGAFQGEYVWEMQSDGLVAHDFVSGDMPVVTTQPVIAGVAIRKTSGTGSHTLDVQFYDSGGLSLGAVSPDGSLGDNTDFDPGDGWTVIGGIIPIASIPAGAVNARIRLRRTLATALASVVQFDAFRFYQPDAAVTATYVKWFGYVDGDREGRGDEYVSGRYEWSGTPGDSASSGPGVMMDPGIPMLIDYTSGVGKIEDRIFLEQWIGTQWVRVHNGEWVDSSSNEIFLPNNEYQNQGHYRVMVEAKNGALLVGSSPWMEFQTDYEGPAQLPILTLDEDSDNARITVTFPQSDLPTEELLEIQLAVQPAGGDIVIVDRITDPQATTAAFHFPLARVVYKVMVRQVRDTEYGPVESRWSAQSGTVEYSDWHFKGVEDPVNDHVRFSVWADTEPSDEPQAEVTAMRGWGEAKPTHYLNSADYYIGLTPVQIMSTDADRQHKNDALNRLIGKIACLLQTLPDEKRFVTVTSAPRKLARRPYWVTYDVAWEENGWVEDAVRREG